MPPVRHFLSAVPCFRLHEIIQVRKQTPLRKQNRPRVALINSRSNKCVFSQSIIQIFSHFFLSLPRISIYYLSVPHRHQLAGWLASPQLPPCVFGLLNPTTVCLAVGYRLLNWSVVLARFPPPPSSHRPASYNSHSVHRIN